MTRRDLLKCSAAFSLAAAIPCLDALHECMATEPTPTDNSDPKTGQVTTEPHPLVPPATGPIPVAFVVSKDAVVIDFGGPWAVFEAVRGAGGEEAFHPYLVAETMEPIRASAGLTILPNFTFQTAPPPKVVVIPAQSGESPTMLAWIRAAAKTADVTMSVCTGAFVLAKTGLLSGKAATTHHDAYMEFAMAFPDIQLKRGARFVEDGNLASSGGLSSGIDLALRVVERYFGRERAEQTADTMEYQGRGWLNPASNQAYAQTQVSTAGHPLCALCSMDGDPALKTLYKGETYYFCSPGHKKMFDETPEKFVALLPKAK